MNPVCECDYINASEITNANLYVGTHIGKMKLSSNISFMISQGPMTNTCIHHLQMIHEQRVDIVVMLTTLEDASDRGKYPGILVTKIWGKINK